GRLWIVVVVVEGLVLVIALYQAPARRVIARGREQERGIFAQRKLRLYETLAEARLADDQPTVMVLDCAGNDFRSRRAPVIDEDDQGHFNALVAAHRIIRALRRRPPA